MRHVACVRDCHAEVLARRALHRYLLLQLHSCVRGEASIMWLYQQSPAAASASPTASASIFTRTTHDTANPQPLTTVQSADAIPDLAISSKHVGRGAEVQRPKPERMGPSRCRAPP